MSTTPSGTYFTPEQVEAMRALVGCEDIASHFADAVIACAYVTGQTPKSMLVRLAEGYPITDEMWESFVAPELAYALGDDDG